VDRPILNELVPIPRVWDRMAAVEERLLEATRSDDAFLTDIAQHLLRAGGKRYRPLLAQVAAELGPGDGDGSIEAGVSVELVHVGSLYHDDVLDEADARRGQVSVNENWTNTIAILAGDFLLARASEIAAALGEAEEFESQLLGRFLLVGPRDESPKWIYRAVVHDLDRVAVVEERRQHVEYVGLRLGTTAVGRVAVVDLQHQLVRDHVPRHAALDVHGLERLAVAAAVDLGLPVHVGIQRRQQGPGPVDGIATHPRAGRVGPHAP